jgi:hypothetical protein
MPITPFIFAEFSHLDASHCHVLPPAPPPAHAAAATPRLQMMPSPLSDIPRDAMPRLRRCAIAFRFISFLR